MANPGGAAAVLNYLLVDHPEEPAIPNRVLEKYKSAQKKVVGGRDDTNRSKSAGCDSAERCLFVRPC